MKRHVIFALSLVLTLAVCAAGLAADGLTLRLKLEKGRTYRVTTVSEQTIRQTILGLEQEIKQTIAMGYCVEVTGVGADGAMNMRFTYDMYRVRQESAMGVQEYDSAQPEVDVPQAFQGYAALIGLGFEATCDSRGRLVEIDGMDQMIDRMLAKMGLPEGDERDQFAELMRGQYGDEAMKRSMGMLFCLYPEGPLAVGDEWTQEMQVDTGFPMSLTNTYTLVARKDGRATLRVHSGIAPNGDNSLLQVSGMECRLALSGEQEGTIEVDEATGLTVRSRLTQKIEGELSFITAAEDEDAGEEPEGDETESTQEDTLSWPMYIEAVTTVEMQ